MPNGEFVKFKASIPYSDLTNHQFDMAKIHLERAFYDAAGCHYKMALEDYGAFCRTLASAGPFLMPNYKRENNRNINYDDAIRLVFDELANDIDTIFKTECKCEPQGH